MRGSGASGGGASGGAERRRAVRAVCMGRHFCRAMTSLPPFHHTKMAREGRQAAKRAAAAPKAPAKRSKAAAPALRVQGPDPSTPSLDELLDAPG